jgi:hypothetical protein
MLAITNNKYSKQVLVEGAIVDPSLVECFNKMISEAVRVGPGDGKLGRSKCSRYANAGATNANDD